MSVTIVNTGAGVARLMLSITMANDRYAFSCRRSQVGSSTDRLMAHERCSES